jgi:serine/threonine-protein kinase RsbW
MGKKSSERIASRGNDQEAPKTREPLVFFVSSSPAHLQAVLARCSDVPDPTATYATIGDLMAALARLEKLSLAFVVIVEKTAADVDVPLLRSCKLEYPQLNYVLILETCEPASLLRFQSLGVQNVLLPPYEGVSLAREIATALPNIPQFKRHPDLANRGLVRLDFLLPSDLSYVLGVNHLISLLLKEFGYPSVDYRINIPLAVDEAVTNAIVHGNRSDPRKKVSVHVYVSSSRFKIRIKDQGDGFDFASLADPTQGQNLMRSSGRGVYLMQSIMDKVVYTEGGRSVELEKVNEDAGVMPPAGGEATPPATSL